MYRLLLCRNNFIKVANRYVGIIRTVNTIPYTYILIFEIRSYLKMMHSGQLQPLKPITRYILKF